MNYKNFQVKKIVVSVEPEERKITGYIESIRVGVSDNKMF